MIFHRFCSRLERLPEKIKMPLFECPVCMTPWWGTAIYLTAYFTHLPEFAELSVQRLIFTVFIVAGINTIFLFINKIYDTLLKQEEAQPPPNPLR